MADQLADTIAEGAADQREPDTDPAPDRAAGRKHKRSRTTTRSSGTSAKSTPKGRSKSGHKKSLREPLENVLALVGTSVSALDPFDGAVILANVESTAKRLDDLAKDNDALHRVLSAMVIGQTGPLALVSALAPIVLPILWRHGALPSSPIVDVMAMRYTPADAMAHLPTDPADPDAAPASGLGGLLGAFQYASGNGDAAGPAPADGVPADGEG